MAKLRIDKLVKGNAVWHEHQVEDIGDINDNYVPYTGAITDVNLGDNALITQDINSGSPASSTSTGNDLKIESGDGGATSGNGGLLEIYGGMSSNGYGGELWIGGGDSLNGDGGVLDLGGGASYDGNGATAYLYGGNSYGGNGNGGNLELSGGTKNGSGSNGYVYINNPINSKKSILDVSQIATSDKTFTFPNQSGTFALTSDLSGYVPFTGSPSDVDLNNKALTNVKNIGIGTASPIYKLEVRGTASEDAIRSYAGFDIYQVEDPTTAPVGTLIADGGSGNLGVGDYYYDVVYTTALGKTHISPLSAKVTTNSTHKSVMVTIPVSSDSRVTGRILYRTAVGEASTLAKVLAVISNNVDTTFEDNIPDSSLGALFPYWESNSTSNQITINGVKSMTLDGNATMFGRLAGSSITSAGEPTLFGSNAGKSITSGMRNTLIGSNSGYSLNAGSDNTAVGRSSLYSITTGNYNTAVGNNAGANIGTSSGSNTMVGWGALAGVSGNANNYNVALGLRSGYGNTTGSYNTFLGTYTGYANTTGANGIHIGYYAGKYETAGNKLIIDSIDRSNEATSRTSALIYGVSNATPANQILALGGGGKVGINTISPTAYLDVNSDIIRLRTSKTPASAGASGNAGDICWDSNYIYVCVATNTWKRTALSTW